MPPWVLASGPKPCGGNYKQQNFNIECHFRRKTNDVSDWHRYIQEQDNKYDRFAIAA